MQTLLFDLHVAGALTPLNEAVCCILLLRVNKRLKLRCTRLRVWLCLTQAIRVNSHGTVPSAPKPTQLAATTVV